MTAVASRGLGKKLAKDAIKMGERSKTNFKRDFTDPQVRVEQQILSFFDPNPCNVICEIYPGRFLKQFAEMEPAGVNHLRNLIEVDILSLVFLYVSFGPSDHWGFGILLLHDYLVSEHREMLGKNLKQGSRRLLLFLRHHPGGEVSILHSFSITAHTQFRQHCCGALKLTRCPLLAKQLACL